MSKHDDLDPLNSPSRDSYHQVESTSPFSRMFASSSISEPPLIDFTSSPSPPRQSHPFVPLPLSLPSTTQSKQQSLFPPSTSNTRRGSSSPLKFSILEDSFSDLPPSFPSLLSHVEERSEEEEGGLVSFIQDSPPPSLKRLEKENASPTRRRSGGSGRKWGVMQKLKEDRMRRRSTSLSPVKEAGGASPYSARDGDSIAQISGVDLSLIQDEAGSFLLPDDDSTTGQSFERSVGDGRTTCNLSQIGEEEEEEDSKGVEEVSVGLNTMFLQPRVGTELDISHLGDQSKFVPLESRGEKKPVFDQSTLPRQFTAPPSLTRSNSSSSILPPELVSPMKSSRPRPPPSSSSSSYLPTPDPSPLLSTDQPLPFDQSSLSFALPTHQLQDTPFDQTFLNKSSVSFIKECKTPRTARRQARVSDSSNSNTSGSSSGISQVGVEGEEGEMTDFGFTQFGLFGREGETSTAILEQLPPTSIFNPESTRTIELCLQRPILPTHTGDSEEDLASSTRTVKASDHSGCRDLPTEGEGEEMDLMGMEEPSMFLKSNESGVGEMTMELTGSGEGMRETGAERLKRRMKELRAAQTQTQQGSTTKGGGGRSLYTIPSTPSAAPSTRTGSSRFVSLLDQTPQPRPLETQRRMSSSTVRPVPSSTSRGTHVGTLISFDTPFTRRPTSALATPAPAVPSTTSRPRARSSLLPPPSSRQLPEAPKTPGERKESTRARLERMRSERKVREEETLSSSSEGGKGTAGGGGLKRSNSVGTRLTVGKVEGGMTRSRSTTGVAAKSTTSTTLADRMLASKPSASSRPSETKATTAPRKSIAMPPPASTSTRRSSLVPSASSSRLVKRPSLLPTSSSASSLSSISKREPLKPTTVISRPAGTGSRK